LPKILKSNTVLIDNENRVKVKVSKSNVFVDDKNDEEFINKNAEHYAEDIVKKADKTVEKMLKEAQEEAQRIVNEANQTIIDRVEKIEKKNSNIGFKQGYEEGLAETGPIKEEAKLILEQAKKEAQLMINQAEPEIINIMIKILDKIFFKTLNLNKGLMPILVKESLDSANLMERVIIRVSKEDYEEVNELKAEILAKVDSSTTVEIMKDFSLNPKDCIIETPFGNLDCSLEQQFEALKKDLYYLFENG
jgi:flagellar assembly protein FliH